MLQKGKLCIGSVCVNLTGRRLGLGSSIALSVMYMDLPSIQAEVQEEGWYGAGWFLKIISFRSEARMVLARLK